MSWIQWSGTLLENQKLASKSSPNKNTSLKNQMWFRYWTKEQVYPECNPGKTINMFWNRKDGFNWTRDFWICLVLPQFGCFFFPFPREGVCFFFFGGGWKPNKPNKLIEKYCFFKHLSSYLSFLFEDLELKKFFFCSCWLLKPKQPNTPSTKAKKQNNWGKMTLFEEQHISPWVFSWGVLWLPKPPKKQTRSQGNQTKLTKPR